MKRMYLDSNVLIYLVEQPPVFGAQATAFVEQAVAIRGELFTSDLALAECAYGACKRGLIALADAYARMAEDSRRISIVNVGSDALAAAARLGPPSRLKLIDSLHVALALKAGCAEFISNDRAFGTNLPIKITNPFC